MSNPLWPNKQAGPHESEIENILKDIHRHGKERANDIIDLAHNVASLRAEFKNFIDGYQEDLVTIPTNFSDTFNSQGYRLNSLFVSDTTASAGAKLVINYYGTKYTKTLVAGENELDIPHGATYIAMNDAGDLSAFSAMLTRYNFRR